MKTENPFYHLFGNPYRIPVRRYPWYPPIGAIEKNEEYAHMLTMDLAAAQSEMTSVHQYYFQSWNIAPCFPTARIVVERILQVELFHFYVIGQLITCLGGKASLP